MAKYLDQDGLLYFWQQLKTLFAGKVDKETGKGLSTNDFTNADVTKLSSIASGAEVNQNAFSNVVVGETTLAADTKTDTLTITPGANVTFTPNAASDSFTIAATVPTKTSDLTNDSGYITGADVPEGAAASTTTPLMDGTASVGTETAFARGDHRHPSDSTKVDKVTGKGLSTNDFTDNEKNKLDGIGAAEQTGALVGLTILTIPNNDGENLDEYYLVNSAGMQGVSNLLAQKAPLESPGFTGTPTATTASAGTNTTQLATTAFVQTAISGKQNTLTFDSTPTSGSSNPVTSGGIYTALGNYLTTSVAASTYATKAEISTAYRYKGSVASVADLPASGNTVGDVYDVQATDMNYAWNGTAWDQLGSTFTITSITNAEIDTIMAA